jgi:hypothetical protein
VETALPKAGGAVRVVRGEHKGEVGQLLERNGSLQRAAVQLQGDMTIVQLKFDDVSEWAGH